MRSIVEPEGIAASYTSINQPNVRPMILQHSAPHLHNLLSATHRAGILTAETCSWYLSILLHPASPHSRSPRPVARCNYVTSFLRVDLVLNHCAEVFLSQSHRSNVHHVSGGNTRRVLPWQATEVRNFGCALHQSSRSPARTSRHDEPSSPRETLRVEGLPGQVKV